jgi:serine/threonine-protein kinase
MSKTDGDHDLMRLASDVDAGKAVDWDRAAETSGGLDTEEIIRQLRVLADVAAAHRTEIGRRREQPLSKWGPLEILREIGHGGCGTVYLAWEPALERSVALKILHDVDQSWAVINEGRMLALVHHENVVKVLGADDHDGEIGIWMELIEGLTLKQVLAKQGPLSAKEAGLIGLELCRAVAAVHKAGLLHRDIKVHNVMREHGGRIVLMDFGTGEIQTDEARESLSVAGTPAYVAPEILNGKGATIETDIYSLGVLLYHLVSVEYPVPGDTLEAIEAAHANGQFVPLADRRPDLPGAFLGVVGRALARDPKQRYGTVGAMHDALFEALDLGASTSQKRIEPPRRTGAPSLAVLPFVSLGPEHDIEYFCDGLVQELITGLTKVGGLRVASRISSMSALQQPAEVESICRQLDVDVVLEGTVRKQGNRLRIHANLVKPADGCIWADVYERQMADVIGVQEEIARSVVESLKMTLGGRLTRRHSENWRASHLYFKGRSQWSHRYHGGLRTALECFRKAIEEDPRYALAHAGIADVYVFLGFYSLERPRVAFARALAAAERALEIEPDCPEAYISRALFHLGGDWNWTEAERDIRRAIECGPPQGLAHIYLSWLLIFRGDVAGALAEARVGQQIDPDSLPVNGGVAYSLFLARRFDEAVKECKKVLERDPNFIVAIYIEAMALAQMGELADAIVLMERATAMSERAPFYLGLLGNFYARAGERQRVEELLAELERLRAVRYVPPHAFAYIYAGLQDIDRAIEWEAKAYEDGAPPFNYVSHVIDNLHGDPRHIAELRRMGWQG